MPRDASRCPSAWRCYHAQLIPRAESIDVLEILKAGGWAMLPILICSALALAIVLERFWVLRRANVLPAGLGEEVRQWARSGQLDPEHLQKLQAGSPLGELLAAALVVRNRSRELIKERIEDTGRHVVHRMERYLNTLGTIALIGPLLGLLGTVIGLIRMFMQVMDGGMADPTRMAGGIGEADLHRHRSGRGDSSVCVASLFPFARQRLRGRHGETGLGAARRTDHVRLGACSTQWHPHHRDRGLSAHADRFGPSPRRDRDQRDLADRRIADLADVFRAVDHLRAAHAHAGEPAQGQRR
jgi:biopolymer transport protein ExbB